MALYNIDDLQKQLNSAKTETEKALIYYNIGSYYTDAEEFEQAIPNYLKALELGVGDSYIAIAQMNLADHYGRAGNYEEAQKYYNKCGLSTERDY